MGVSAGERDRWAFVALVGFAVVMYVVPAEWISGAASLRLALLSSGLAAGLMMLRRLGRLEPVRLDGVRGAALIAFAVLAVASTLWSINPAVTRTTGIELVKLAAIYLTMINVVTSWKRLGVLCASMVLASIVTSIGVIHWYFRGVDLVEGYRARWVGVYADPNHMAMDLALVVPLGLAILTRRQWPTLVRLLCGAGAALSVVAIVLSHSRGGFLGLVVAVAIWAFREQRRLQAVVAGGALVAGLLVFAPQSFWQRTQTVATFEEDASAMGRVHAWEVTAGMSRAHPIVGVGAGAFRFAWPLYAPPEARRAYVAHNVFLDVIGELGMVGLMLFLVFAGGAAGGAFRASTDSSHGWLARAIGASVAGYLVCDLFSGYILSAHLYVLFGLGACADLIARRQANEPARAMDPVVVSHAA